ncbi:hypothetical protein BpHYR1_038503 [Brachionus plicatilis]|uniref:Uncharacterized protein n=1 Tax=Brachionus plicatilis TaxID=10195 RepID=A0A3M7S1F1_BRAPC|nr:hypothetical protein BpHYR1_038503 [Brachionus plicatilis]
MIPPPILYTKRPSINLIFSQHKSSDVFWITIVPSILPVKFEFNFKKKINQITDLTSGFLLQFVSKKLIGFHLYYSHLNFYFT